MVSFLKVYKVSYQTRVYFIKSHTANMIFELIFLAAM